jgi:hypothetical protein
LHILDIRPAPQGTGSAIAHFDTALTEHLSALEPGELPMKVLSIRQAPPGVDGKAIAHYDAEISPHVRLLGLRLVLTPDGRFLTYAANDHGKPTATFSREFANGLSRAASAAYREGIANDRAA